MAQPITFLQAGRCRSRRAWAFYTGAMSVCEGICLVGALAGMSGDLAFFNRQGLETAAAKPCSSHCASGIRDFRQGRRAVVSATDMANVAVLRIEPVLTP